MFVCDHANVTPVVEGPGHTLALMGRLLCFEATRIRDGKRRDLQAGESFKMSTKDFVQLSKTSIHRDKGTRVRRLCGPCLMLGVWLCRDKSKIEPELLYVFTSRYWHPRFPWTEQCLKTHWGFYDTANLLRLLLPCISLPSSLFFFFLARIPGFL